MTIKQITLLLVIGGLVFLSCSKRVNEDRFIESSNEIDTVNLQKSGIEESGKSDLNFIIPPEIALAVFAIPENEECTLSNYIEELNNNVPREYSAKGKNIIMERIIKIGNTLYVKIKVPSSITDKLSEPVELEMLRLIFKDCITSGADKYDEFRRGLTLLHDNGLDISFQIKSPTDTKLLTIKNAELIPAQQ